MAEFEWIGEPERPSLRRAIRHRLRQFDPTIRIVAEGFLAESSEIDLFGVGGEGELISVRIEQTEGDALVLTRALADLTWLRPRCADLLKLSPGLGLEPSAEPRALLFCPEFSSETRAAIDNFPSRMITPIGYRCLREQGQLSVLFEPLKPTPLQPVHAARRASPNRPPSVPLDPAPTLHPHSDPRVDPRVDPGLEPELEGLPLEDVYRTAQAPHSSSSRTRARLRPPGDDGLHRAPSGVETQSPVAPHEQSPEATRRPGRPASQPDPRAAAPASRAPDAARTGSQRTRSVVSRGAPRIDPPSHSMFRTGLSDADLLIEPEEKKALD